MKHVAGRPGVSLAVIAMAAMAILSYFFTPLTVIGGEAGICAPSPNLWNIAPAASWIIDNVLILAIAVAAVFANKKLVFIPGSDYVMPTLFLVMAAANPWLTATLNSSTIICAANLGALYLLMNAYGHRNVTQEMFVIGTLAGLGGMVQYAFLLFVPVHLISAATLQLVRPKAICAYLLGLIAPYWTLIGLGVITPQDFALPQLASLFSVQIGGLDLFFVLLQIGIAVGGMLLSVTHNSLTLYNTSVRLMLFNRVICIIGFGAAILACIDFLNYMAYIETTMLVAAIQIANTFQANRNRYSSWILLGLCLVYVILFILILTA